MAVPVITNKIPANNSKGIDGFSLISFDITDVDGLLDVNSIDAYVSGNLALSGSSFVAPYDGPDSSISTITDGFRIVINYTGLFDAATDIVVRVVNPLIDESWSFRTGNAVLFVEELPYEITLGVEFKEPLLSNSAVTNPANYVFNNNMYARFVEQESPTKVKLWVENFHTYSSFTLSVSSRVVDINGYPIPNSYNSVSFSPFQSTADLTNFNGKVRTWRESKLVSADTERVYLAGEKGIDVFNKILKTTTGRWGQVFGSPIEAMFVANFGGGYKFRDEEPPYLVDQSPSPGETVSTPDTHLEFTIRDKKTAVEPTAISIFVNGIKAFGGDIGWLNGFSGQIVIKHKNLEVVVTHPSPIVEDSTVSVRVLATDLMGNSLDTQYLYYVVSPIALHMGWGFGMFGLSNFGFGEHT